MPGTYKEQAEAEKWNAIYDTLARLVIEDRAMNTSDEGGNVRGTYGYDNLWINEGDRVEISPGTDLWMSGDRYGTVVSIPRTALEVMDGRHVRIKVRMDKSSRVVTGSGETFRAI